MATTSIKSEVTGTIWKVEVEVGQVVSQDDVLLIVESMKMEIPVISPAKGRILDIMVTEGEMVADMQVLLVLEN